jgi:hypothetical protein
MILFDPSTDGSLPAGVPSGAVLEPRGYPTAVVTAAALAGAVALASFAAGRVAGSHALVAAALAPLGTALTGGLDRAMARAPARRRRMAFLATASLLSAGGLVVLGTTFGALLSRTSLPAAGLMGGIALAMMAVQIAMMLLLLGGRDKVARGSGVASARWGAMGHGFVALAALGIGLSGSDWPDLIVAANLAALVLLSTLHGLRRVWIDGITGEDQGVLSPHPLSSHGSHKDFA